MRKRTLSREKSLRILYQSDITGKPISSVSAEVREQFPEDDSEMWHFALQLVRGVEANISEIDLIIAKYATNWQINRMAIIDRNILRLGVFELLKLTDVPPKVTINEAVELAKKYGDLESSKFVNGVLDNIHKKEMISSDKIK